MARVLWLAYHFPPVGGGGVQRSVKFVRDLRPLGYEAVVVTGPGAADDRWTPADHSLLREVPAGTTVQRLLTPAPDRGTRRRGRTERWLGFEPAFSRWWREGAIATGSRLDGIDLVYASLSPYESAAAALELARGHAVPCVLDLRDPWALDEMRVFPTAAHRLREVRRMRAALAAADAVVLNTAEATHVVLERFTELRRSRIATLPNGFDALDFAGEAPRRHDAAFRIVHAGYLHTALGYDHRRRGALGRALGGSHAGVDILSRSHVYLLEAAERVLRTDPRLGGTLELHLAGVLSPEDGELTEARAVSVRTHGYLPHAESVALVRSADLLFLPMHDLPAGRRARIVPGKTYEYVASGRPILAAVPDGDARDLLSSIDSAFVCRPADVEAMAGILARRLHDHRNGDRAPTKRAPVVAPFERRAIARRLATLFDSVLEEARDRRGTAARRRRLAA